MTIRPRHIEAATCGAISARRAGDYLRGERAITLTALAEILHAMPMIDAREFVRTLDEAKRAKDQLRAGR
jgi:hypothetical protein